MGNHRKKEGETAVKRRTECRISAWKVPMFTGCIAALSAESGVVFQKNTGKRFFDIWKRRGHWWLPWGFSARLSVGGQRKSASEKRTGKNCTHRRHSPSPALSPRRREGSEHGQPKTVSSTSRLFSWGNPVRWRR